MDSVDSNGTVNGNNSGSSTSGSYKSGDNSETSSVASSVNTNNNSLTQPRSHPTTAANTSPLVRCYSQSQADNPAVLQQHHQSGTTNGFSTGGGGVGGHKMEGNGGCNDDVQERIDLLEREKKVLQYHNQFLKVTYQILWLFVRI